MDFQRILWVRSRRKRDAHTLENYRVGRLEIVPDNTRARDSDYSDAFTWSRSWIDELNALFTCRLQKLERRSRHDKVTIWLNMRQKTQSENFFFFLFFCCWFYNFSLFCNSFFACYCVFIRLYRVSRISARREIAFSTNVLRWAVI